MCILDVKDFTDEMDRIENFGLKMAYTLSEIEYALDDLLTTYELACDFFWMNKDEMSEIRMHYLQCQSVLEREYSRMKLEEEDLLSLFEVLSDDLD